MCKQCNSYRYYRYRKGLVTMLKDPHTIYTMIDITTILILIAVFLVTYIYFKWKVPSGLPPGPKGQFFFGHLRLFFKNKTPVHVKTKQWAKEFGGLYTLQCGPASILIVTDVNILKEALIEKADVWSDRPINLARRIKLTQQGDAGVLMQNGKVWKQLRRVTMQSMRDFGLGKQSLEDKILDELEEVCTEIEGTNEKPFKFDMLFNQAIANVICNVLFGHRYSYENDEFRAVAKTIQTLFMGGSFRNIAIVLPWFTLFLLPLINSRLGQLKVLKGFIQKNVNEHRETFDADNIRDFIDMYLAAEKSEEKDVFTGNRMFGTIFELFFAGTDTTASTLLWAIIFLIRYPLVQEKCRKEIRKNIGINRKPQYKDRTELSYVEATVLEVQRLASTAPMLILHTAKYTAKLHGYTIPKHTLLVPNSYAIHTDERYWDTPMEFKPERFLNEDGSIKIHEAFMPFGIGKRSCLGENLAKQELFLFITGLLQRFQFEAEDVAGLPKVETTTPGSTLIPDPFEVIARKITT